MRQSMLVVESVMVYRPPEISVVVPVYNEAENAPQLAAEIDAALSGRAYEMIFVNDASTDETATVLTGLKSTYPDLRAVSYTHLTLPTIYSV